MTILDELLSHVDSLDEDAHDYHNVRAIKRIAHHLAKINESINQNLDTAK